MLCGLEKNAFLCHMELLSEKRRVTHRETSSCSLRNDLLLSERKRAEK